MPAYMYIHPFFGALTIANWAVKRFLSEGAGFADFPLSFIPHAVLAIFGLLALFVQASIGSKMYVSRGSLSAILPFHRFNAKVLIVLSAIVFLLGLITVSIMIANEYF